MTAQDSSTVQGSSVAAYLLYRNPQTAIATTYLHALNEAVEESGELFAFADDGSEEEWVFESENCRVCVLIGNAAAPADTFKRALDYPFLDAVFPAGRAIVKGHGGFVRISLTRATEAEPKALLPLLRMLRSATQVFAGQHFPLAVHWCQCDNLLAGPDFVQMADRGLETELFVKAVPYSTQAETGASYGAVTNGAANLIGREVELAEAPMPASWAADRLLQFVDQARSGVPAAGEALRFPTDEIMLVHDEPGTDERPDGHLKLTVEKLPTGVPVQAPGEAALGFLSDMDTKQAARGFGRR